MELKFKTVLNLRHRVSHVKRGTRERERERESRWKKEARVRKIKITDLTDTCMRYIGER